MITLSNGLSFVRAPLALLFLQENTLLRLMAIILAMMTDSIDGYLARRYRSTSKFGAFLDPAMDKFFVYFVLSVLFIEGSILRWEVLAMLSRDFFLFIFAFYLICTKKLSSHQCKSIIWGKVTTAMQFLVLIGVTLHYSFSWIIYGLFITFGIFAFLELFQKRTVSPSA